jgi:hypothetical protein
MLKPSYRDAGTTSRNSGLFCGRILQLAGRALSELRSGRGNKVRMVSSREQRILDTLEQYALKSSSTLWPLCRSGFNPGFAWTGLYEMRTCALLIAYTIRLPMSPSDRSECESKYWTRVEGLGAQR